MRRSRPVLVCLVVAVFLVSAMGIALMPASAWQLAASLPLQFQYGRVSEGKIEFHGPVALVSFTVDRGYGTQTLVLSGKWATSADGGYELDLDNCLTGLRVLKFAPVRREAWYVASALRGTYVQCDHCHNELAARLGRAQTSEVDKLVFRKSVFGGLKST